jgi:hypothetical protein
MEFRFALRLAPLQVCILPIGQVRAAQKVWAALVSMFRVECRDCEEIMLNLLELSYC